MRQVRSKDQMTSQNLNWWNLFFKDGFCTNKRVSHPGIQTSVTLYPVFQNSSQWNPDDIFRIELSGRHYFESSCPNDVLYCVPLEPWVLFLLHKTVSKSVGRRFLITPGNIAIWHMFQYVGCLKSSTCTFWDILPLFSACNSQKTRAHDSYFISLCLCPRKGLLLQLYL